MRDGRPRALHLEPDFAALLPEGERTFDGLLAIADHVIQDKDGRRTVRFERGGREFFIKQHRGVGWAEIAKNLSYFRLPALSARTEWQAIAALEAAGLQGARVVGRGLRGRNPARQESFVVLESLNGHTEPLHRLVTGFMVDERRRSHWQ